MLRYDTVQRCYSGEGLRVAPRVFCERAAALIARGETPGRAFERLLDEATWTAKRTPGSGAAGGSAAGAYGATVCVSLSLPSGPLTLRARTAGSGPGWIDLVPALIPDGLSTRSTGALVRLTMPDGRSSVGQLQGVSPAGELHVAVAERHGHEVSEHRAQLRYLPLEPVQALALVSTSGGGAAVRVAVTDMSRSGVGLVVPRALRAGARLTLQLPVQNGEHAFIAGARVIWSEARPVGWRVGTSLRGPAV